MKKIIVLLIVISGIFACNKEETTDFEGKWRLEKVSGGISGKGYQENFKYLEFLNSEDCQWLDSTNTKLSTGNYSISEKDGKNYINFNSENNSTFQSFKLLYRFPSSDSLLMAQEGYDLYDYTFIKE